jgi:hypothetical protein
VTKPHKANKIDLSSPLLLKNSRVCKKKRLRWITFISNNRSSEVRKISKCKNKFQMFSSMILKNLSLNWSTSIRVFPLKLLILTQFSRIYPFRWSLFSKVRIATRNLKKFRFAHYPSFKYVTYGAKNLKSKKKTLLLPHPKWSEERESRHQTPKRNKLTKTTVARSLFTMANIKSTEKTVKK